MAIWNEGWGQSKRRHTDLSLEWTGKRIRALPLKSREFQRFKHHRQVAGSFNCNVLVLALPTVPLARLILAKVKLTGVNGQLASEDGQVSLKPIRFGLRLKLRQVLRKPPQNVLCENVPVFPFLHLHSSKTPSDIILVQLFSETRRGSNIFPRY